MLGSSWVDAQLAVSQDGVSSMSEWVSELHYHYQFHKTLAPSCRFENTFPATSILRSNKNVMWYIETSSNICSSFLYKISCYYHLHPQYGHVHWQQYHTCDLQHPMMNKLHPLNHLSLLIWFPYLKKKKPVPLWQFREYRNTLTYTVCPGFARTVFIKNTRCEIFSKFHSFYSK
jgi:hypothetical protein